MTTPLQELAGRRGLFIGVGGEHSPSWRCARRMADLGARLALSCSSPAHTAKAFGLGRLLPPCDLQQPAAVRDVVDAAAVVLGGFDFVVHDLPDAPRQDDADDLGCDTSEDFLRAMRLLCMSFADTARLCVPHMTRGGAILSLPGTAGATEPAALACLRASILRYLALELQPLSIQVLRLEAPARRATAAIATPTAQRSGRRASWLGALSLPRPAATGPSALSRPR